MVRGVAVCFLFQRRAHLILTFYHESFADCYCLTAAAAAAVEVEFIALADANSVSLCCADFGYSAFGTFRCICGAVMQFKSKTFRSHRIDVSIVCARTQQKNAWAKIPLSLCSLACLPAWVPVRVLLFCVVVLILFLLRSIFTLFSLPLSLYLSVFVAEPELIKIRLGCLCVVRARVCVFIPIRCCTAHSHVIYVCLCVTLWLSFTWYLLCIGAHYPHTSALVLTS